MPTSNRSKAQRALTTPTATTTTTKLPRTTPYQEVEFRIIPPHGGNGERPITFSFSAPPRYKRIIELLYSHAGTPWRTESDVLRAFLDLGCHHFGPAVDGIAVIPGILHQLDMMNALIDEARRLNDFAESINALDTQVQRLIDGGMRESAVGLVYRYRDEAKRIKDAILRRKLLNDIGQRFAHLLKGSQGRRESERAPSVVDVDENEQYEGHHHEGEEE